jgi:hypothetical protein
MDTLGHSDFTSHAEHEAAIVPVPFNIDPSKIIDLITSKQTQYYTLWAVYTAVQFAAGNYGSSQELSHATVLVVLVGVWMFNLGHLSFVLQCVDQLSRLDGVLNAALHGGQARYREELRSAFDNMEGGFRFLHFPKRGMQRISYLKNTAVHLVIDICASLALLTRVHWINL